MDGAKVGVFEETDEVGLGGFLEGKEGGGLESDISLAVVGDVLDDSLERKLSDQKIGGLLVLSDLSESDGTWSVSVWLLDTSGNWGALSGGLAGDVLSWSLNSGGALSSGSLCSGHFF